MKSLLLLFTLSLLPLAAPAGDIVSRNVRYKSNGPVTSQYVFQANDSRSRSYSSRNSGYTSRSYGGYGYRSGSNCYPYSSFRSYYPAYRSTRVTVIHRPVVIHRPAVRVQAYRAYRPTSRRCR